jgi:acyl dehydratase
MRRRFSWGGSVHAKCDIAFLKPVRLGSTIHVTGRISGKYERRGGRYVVFELLTTDANGDPVCRVDNAMLLNFREVASARRSVAGATSAAPAPTPDDTEARPALVQRFGSKALRRDDIIAFYQAEEDIYGAHPSLHNDASLARAAGLADIIAPGRYSIALANCLFARVHGPGWLLGARYSVSFMGNLLPGTRADIRATARGVVGAAGGMARQFDLQCDDRASGRVLLSGTVRFSDGH